MADCVLLFTCSFIFECVSSTAPLVFFWIHFGVVPWASGSTQNSSEKIFAGVRAHPKFQAIFVSMHGPAGRPADRLVARPACRQTDRQAGWGLGRTSIQGTPETRSKPAPSPPPPPPSQSSQQKMSRPRNSICEYRIRYVIHLKSNHTPKKDETSEHMLFSILCEAQILSI